MQARSRSHEVLDLCEAPDKLPLHRGVSVSAPGSWPTPRPCHVRGIRDPWLQVALTVQLLSVCGNFLSHVLPHTPRTICETSHASPRAPLSLCLAGGLAHFSLSPASPPRLQPHLCPSVSLVSALARWDKVGGLFLAGQLRCFCTRSCCGQASSSGSTPSVSLTCHLCPCLFPSLPPFCPCRVVTGPWDPSFQTPSTSVWLGGS